MRVCIVSILLLAGTMFFYGCVPGRLYRIENKHRAYTGLLTDTTFTQLKRFLSSTTQQELRDTILITYNFNHEDCWRNSDQQSDEYLYDWIRFINTTNETVYVQRPGLSYFRFREPGEDVPKLIKWNKQIIVDSSRLLFQTLFTERCTCGSSVLIMPDRRFLFLRSDGHEEALRATKNEIESVFNGTYKGGIFGRK